MDVKAIIERHRMAVESAGRYPVPRDLWQTVRDEQGRHYVGILGPRGVGKTVLLRQLAAAENDCLYLSFDTLDPDADVVALIGKLNRDYGFTTFCLDEVHFRADIEGVLKVLYDTLDIRVRFTSSVALALYDTAYDLSRRVVLRPLLPFSFREFLRFRHDLALAPLPLDAIFNREWTPDHLRAGIHFESYLRGGLMPFALEEPEPLEILTDILETIIRKDIPRVARLHVDELESLKKTIAFIGRSPVDGVNYSTLARNLGITKYKAEQYLDLFEKAFILHRVFPKGTNVLKEPKVLLAPPYRLLFRDYAEALGGLREDFFAEAMRQRNQAIWYLKTTRGAKTPDFVVQPEAGLSREGEASDDHAVIEVGGRGKGTSQFKNFTTDRRYIFAHDDASDGPRRPLFLLGMV